MAKKKTNAELLAENHALRRGNLAIGITNVLINVIRWGALVLIFRYGYLSIGVLAGKTTLASIGIEFLGSLTISQSLAYILGAGGVIYGIGERKLRQRTIKRLGPKREALEASIDPKRTSSNLTEKGETNPKDVT